MPRTPGVDGRQLILDAAARLFYEQGIEATSAEQVAEAAGVTKRALYYHFASKAHLVQAWLEAADEPALALLQAATKSPKSADAHPIGRALDTLRKWLGTTRFHGCAFLNASRERPGDPAVRSLALGHKGAAVRWLEQLAADEGAPDPALRARQYLMLIDAVMATGHLYPPDQVIGTAKSMLAAILAAGDRALARAPET